MKKEMLMKEPLRAEGRTEEIKRKEIAAKLTELWGRAIERDDVDEHSDFYFHGGNHFLAPVMIECINEEMGLQLTVRDLEHARTIAKMTDHIYFEQTRANEVVPSTVVPLRNVHGKRSPLFMVHGVGGNVLGFYSLAKCLDPEQPVYGVQAQALLTDREAVLGMEQMAVQYVKDMREVCPEGPYHLLGFSFGGLVAYEIAQQLKAAGAEVGLLGMLDTRQPELMRGVRTKGPIVKRVFWRMKLLYLRTHRRNGRVRYLWRRFGERMQRANYMYSANRGGGKVASAIRNVREINYVAGVTYSLQPYSGELTLFRAENNAYEQPLPRDLNWGGLAAGGVVIEELPGDHGQILSQPGLGVLAQKLSAALARVEDRLRAAEGPTAREGRVRVEF